LISIPKQTGAKTVTGLFLHPAITIFLIAPCFIACCFNGAKIVKNIVTTHTAKDKIYCLNRQNRKILPMAVTTFLPRMDNKCKKLFLILYFNKFALYFQFNHQRKKGGEL
jgi:hypothetical protein